MAPSISTLEVKIEPKEESSWSDEEETSMTEEEKLEFKFNLNYHKNDMCRICLEIRKNEVLLPMETYITINDITIRFEDCFRRLCPPMLDTQPWYPPNACQKCVDQVVKSHLLVEELRIARNHKE